MLSLILMKLKLNTTPYFLLNEEVSSAPGEYYENLGMESGGGRELYSVRNRSAVEFCLYILLSLTVFALHK
jgi:hypothetical protein